MARDLSYKSKHFDVGCVKNTRNWPEYVSVSASHYRVGGRKALNAKRHALAELRRSKLPKEGTRYLKDIAKELGVSVATICGDYKILRARAFDAIRGLPDIIKAVELSANLPPSKP